MLRRTYHALRLLEKSKFRTGCSVPYPRFCSIWGYMAKTPEHRPGQLFESAQELQPRGPDRSEFKTIHSFNDIYLAFHRLAIMDASSDGDQPFTLEINPLKTGSKTQQGRSIMATCNGELYNFRELAEKYNIALSSRSDCEILTHLYAQLGFDAMVTELRGEFAISILDIDHENEAVKLTIGRDPLGVRPVFIGHDEHGFGYSSTLKGLIDIVDPSQIQQLRGGRIFELNANKTGEFYTDTRCYFDPKDIQQQREQKSLDVILADVRQSLIDAVEIRMESDRPMGALLSGGLDSSLVVSIAANYLRKHGQRLSTYSIGIPGATDRHFAEIVSRHCDTDHTHIELTTQQFLDAIPDVVRMTETHDITTIRASTGQYLCSEWIRKHTDCKVLLIGDGSDEACAGYMYFHNAPDPQASHDENVRLLQDIIYYDVLRADRAIAGHGLEARVPFLDHKFVKTFLSIDPSLRVPTIEVDGQRRIEKWLLRKSFDCDADATGQPWLPHEVLWRMKEAFSDGVSSQKRSWYEIIQEDVDSIYSKSDFSHPDATKHLAPPSKEALHYRTLFNNMYHPDAAQVIPYYWLPKWSGQVMDPSARILSVYQQEGGVSQAACDHLEPYLEPYLAHGSQGGVQQQETEDTCDEMEAVCVPDGPGSLPGRRLSDTA